MAQQQQHSMELSWIPDIGSKILRGIPRFCPIGKTIWLQQNFRCDSLQQRFAELRGSSKSQTSQCGRSQIDEVFHRCAMSSVRCDLASQREPIS